MIEAIPCILNCGGIMKLISADPRTRRPKYKCQKCGAETTLPINNINVGVNTFQLNDPKDPLRGSGLK